MKKISLGLIILSAVLTVAPSVLALTPNTTPGEFRKEIRKEAKEEFKNERLLDKAKNFLKKNLRFEARVKGKITVVGADNLSISGDDGTFQVNVTDKTQLLGKFGGKTKLKLSDYLVDHEVMVIGKFTNEDKTIIEAKVIRNLSIQKRRGAFFGTVLTKGTDSFTMQTLKLGVQTVYFGNAKFVERNETSMTYTDLKIGDRVRVKGVWDKTLNKITEVTQIKDFSIPIVVPTKTTQN
ncbi:conserved exported hypothetical protein [Candidatus Roizmanbacteria bacterium]|nr:conserved exported hypothetical protein [Candidatus Roizmanbacteria bacterium]